MDFSNLRMQMIRAREQVVIDDLNRIEKGEKPTPHDKLIQDVYNAGVRAGEKAVISSLNKSVSDSKSKCRIIQFRSENKNAEK